MEKPRTPEDWQLFIASASGSPITEDGLRRAAAALSTALDRAERAVREGTDVYEAYDAYVSPVAEEYDAMGAADSEPRDVAIDYLLGLGVDRSTSY